MKFLMIGLLLSLTSTAWSQGFDDELYRSTKNAFQNKHAAVKDAHHEYWQEKSKLQQFDAMVLNKEAHLIQAQTALDNITRAFETEKHLKRKLSSGEETNKETVFVKTKNGSITADVNDPKFFTEPAADAKNICLVADPKQCFSFKVEDGKKVLVLNKAQITEEKRNLREIRNKLQADVDKDKADRATILEQRQGFVDRVARAEAKLDKRKENLKEFIEDKNGKNGMSEEFVDRLLKEGKSSAILADNKIDPADADSKAALMFALDNNVFSKSDYSIQKEKDFYQQQDVQYATLYNGVNDLSQKYKVPSPILGQMSQAPVIPANRVPASQEEVVDKSQRVPDEEEALAPAPAPAPPGSEVGKAAGKGGVLGGALAALKKENEDKDVEPTDQDGATPEETGAPKEKVVGTSEEKGTGTPKEKVAGAPEEKATGTPEEKVPGTPEESADTPKPKTQAELDKEKADQEEAHKKELTCKDEALAKLIELFKDDKENILGKQFKLTALKLALLTKNKGNKSLENTVNGMQKDLLTDEKIKKLKEAYQLSGVGEAINQNLKKSKSDNSVDGILKDLKTYKFSYFSKDDRLWNREATVLMAALQNEDTGIKFGVEDQAIAWATNNIHEEFYKTDKERYSVEGNKLSLSSQVNKMMNTRIAGGKELAKEDIEKAIKVNEDFINSKIKAAMNTLSQECKQMLNENCVLIQDVKTAAFEKFMKDVSNITGKVERNKIEGYNIDIKDFFFEKELSEKVEPVAQTEVSVDEEEPAATTGAPAPVEKTPAAADKKPAPVLSAAPPTDAEPIELKVPGATSAFSPTPDITGVTPPRTPAAAPQKETTEDATETDEE